MLHRFRVCFAHWSMPWDGFERDLDTIDPDESARMSA